MQPKRTVLRYYAGHGSVFEAENITTAEGQPLVTWNAPDGTKLVKEANVQKEIDKANRNLSGDFEGGQIRCTATRPKRLAIHHALELRHKERLDVEKQRIEEEEAEHKRQKEKAKEKAQNARKRPPKGGSRKRKNDS